MHFFLLLIFLAHQLGYTQTSEFNNSLSPTESYYVPALNGTKLKKVATPFIDEAARQCTDFATPETAENNFKKAANSSQCWAASLPRSHSSVGWQLSWHHVATSQGYR